MDKNTLPALPVARPRASVSFDLPPHLADRWKPSIRAASTDDNTIGIYDLIGSDYWGEGVTAKRIGAALRAIGGADVTVNINSPGGDVWEAITIYNMLREYQGKVTVKVLGLAASAASVIAMAADEIQIGRASFLMIHNGWVVAMGNRNDLRDVAEYLEPIDRAIAELYAERTGLPAADISKMMDDETYIGGQVAIDSGFADALLSSDQARDTSTTPQNAARMISLYMAQQGVSRTTRIDLLKTVSGFTPGAESPSNSTPGATDEIKPETLANLQKVISDLQRAHLPE